MHWPELDADGHLRDPAAWTPELAGRLAELEGLRLDLEHMKVIEALRAHWQAYGELPGQRLLLRALRQRHGAEFGNSRVLYRLFPDAPLRQACRIAGLPKPVSCI